MVSDSARTSQATITTPKSAGKKPRRNPNFPPASPDLLRDSRSSLAVDDAAFDIRTEPTDADPTDGGANASDSEEEKMICFCCPNNLFGGRSTSSSDSPDPAEKGAPSRRASDATEDGTPVDVKKGSKFGSLVRNLSFLDVDSRRPTLNSVSEARDSSVRGPSSSAFGALLSEEENYNPGREKKERGRKKRTSARRKKLLHNNNTETQFPSSGEDDGASSEEDEGFFWCFQSKSTASDEEEDPESQRISDAKKKRRRRIFCWVALGTGVAIALIILFLHLCCGDDSPDGGDNSQLIDSDGNPPGKSPDVRQTWVDFHYYPLDKEGKAGTIAYRAPIFSRHLSVADPNWLEAVLNSASFALPRIREQVVCFLVERLHHIGGIGVYVVGMQYVVSWERGTRRQNARV